MARPHQRRLLAQHFLRRFMDTDLLSAGADRHEGMSTVAAALVSVGLFGSVLLLLKYTFGMSNGQAALSGMEDRLFLIAISMTVVALATAVQWDALSLDARDAAILGPLPIHRRVIVRAKASAVARYALGVTLAVAIVPNLLFPLASVATLRIGVLATLRVTLAQLLAALAAAAFAFFAVLTVRELVRLLVRGPLFVRISRILQAVVLVLLVTTFLLVVGSPSGMGGRWMAMERTGAGIPASAVPAMWFLGLAESTIGDAIVGPWTLVDTLGRPAATNRWEAAYRSYQPRLRELSGIAVVATVLSVIAGAGAYGLNARQFPQPAGRPAARRRRFRDWLRRSPGATVARHPVARAGFTFTSSVLVRSAPHRLALSVAVAVAFAVTVAIFGGAGLRTASHPSAAPQSAWALQTFVLAALLAGWRQAVALPADLEANWIFHQCWSGDLRQYMTGARRAALMVVALPPALVLLPFHAYVLGTPAALFHALNGLLMASIVVAALSHAHGKPPFISSYVPWGNMQRAAPLYAIGLTVFTFSMAAIERAATRTPFTALVYASILLAIAMVVARAASRRARPVTLALDHRLERVPETLGLSG